MDGGLSPRVSCAAGGILERDERGQETAFKNTPRSGTRQRRQMHAVVRPRMGVVDLRSSNVFIVSYLIFSIRRLLFRKAVHLLLTAAPYHPRAFARFSTCLFPLQKAGYGQNGVSCFCSFTLASKGRAQERRRSYGQIETTCSLWRRWFSYRRHQGTFLP